MLTYKTLLEAGLLYTEDIIWGSSTFNALNPNVFLSSVYIQLKNAVNAFSSTVDYTKTISVAKTVKKLPVS